MEQAKRTLGAKALNRALAGIPRGLVTNADTNQPLTGQPLHEFLQEQISALPPEVYRDARHFLAAILAPQQEGGHLSTRIDLFNSKELLNVANYCSRERPTMLLKRFERKGVKKRQLEINLGIGTDGSAINPTLPSYLELGLQRLKELLNEGYSSSKLRVFSTASIAARFSNDSSKKAAFSRIQGEQRALLAAYLEEFYPKDIAKRVNLAPIEQTIPEIPKKKLDLRVKRIYRNVNKTILKTLGVFSRKYAGDSGYGPIYAAYHGIPETFGDGRRTKVARLSVGGPGEYFFNHTRSWTGLSLGVVVYGRTCETPPYLKRPFDEGVSKLLKVDSSNDAREFLNHRRKLAKEYLTMIRAIKRAPEESDVDALFRLKSFYSNYGIS